MINALDVLRAYPKGQDSGAWIKMRAEVLDANGYNEDGTRIPKCALCSSRDIRDLVAMDGGLTIFIQHCPKCKRTTIMKEEYATT